MSMWIISRGVELLILLDVRSIRDLKVCSADWFSSHHKARLGKTNIRIYFIFKFDISGLLNHVVIAIADRIRGCCEGKRRERDGRGGGERERKRGARGERVWSVSRQTDEKGEGRREEKEGWKKKGESEGERDEEGEGGEGETEGGKKEIEEEQRGEEKGRVEERGVEGG
ncbi:hypothetical protein Tco_0115568 [Tanacetum coccineum]